MKRIILLFVLTILMVYCSNEKNIDNIEQAEDSAIKKSGNVIYCDELPEGSLDQCELRPEL